jgi:hypothetical protein
MKKEDNQAPTSPTARTLIYLGLFVAGLALHELLSRLINTSTWSNSSIILGIATLAIFTFVGAVFACEHHALSRVTSAATLFVLGVIALKMGHTVIPDPYLFAIAFCVAFIGSRTALHRKLVNFKKTTLYSLTIICVALAITAIFAYGVTVADRIVTH